MSESITKLTDDLIASYAKVGGINHLDGGNLPSKFAIASITTDLLRLLLPGFFDEKPIQTSELKVEISMLMDNVSGRLEDELVKSIVYNIPPPVIGPLAYGLTAQEILLFKKRWVRVKGKHPDPTWYQ